MPSKARRCTRCGFNRQLKSYTGPRGRICAYCRAKARRATSKDARLRRTYGITAEEYAALEKSQGGVCGGCHQPRKYALHVDHDHKVERECGSRASVRGLLCKRCNGVLRKVWDDPETLRGLADYLENWPSRKVIR